MSLINYQIENGGPAFRFVSDSEGGIIGRAPPHIDEGKMLDLWDG